MTSPAQRRILCVGMCVLDIIHVCEQYPEEDTDKRCMQGYWQRGGNASNNCTVLRKLGADCEFLGMLSASPAFGFLQADCHQRHIGIGHCPSTPLDPPFSSVILTEATGSRTIIHSNPDFPILTHTHFQRLELDNYAWIHFEARNPQETERMLHDIRAHNARQQQATTIRVSLEVEKRRADLLALAELVDYVFIGKDLAQHMGWRDVGVAVRELRRILASAVTPPAIVCSWGAEGCGCLDAADKFVLVPPVAVTQIVDSLGAGDTFCAATIYALERLQLALPDAVAFGNRCAAYKLAHRGYDAIIDFPQNA